MVQRLETTDQTRACSVARRKPLVTARSRNPSSSYVLLMSPPQPESDGSSEEEAAVKYTVTYIFPEDYNSALRDIAGASAPEAPS